MVYLRPAVQLPGQSSTGGKNGVILSSISVQRALMVAALGNRFDGGKRVPPAPPQLLDRDFLV